MRQVLVYLGRHYVKTFDIMKKKLLVIDEHIQSIQTVEEFDESILESLRMILELFDGLNEV